MAKALCYKNDGGNIEIILVYIKFGMNINQ